MLWNVTLPMLFFLISCSDSGKASAKRGGRQDGGKLVATLCHYYSDGAMGCKECFEVARSHRSNHNSTLLPPCKSVQGIKRRNWTLDDGIITNAVIDTNATKRLTIASCAFYANKTFTCVATRPPPCENLTQIECASNTSWSSRFEGSITDGFRCVATHGPKFTTTTKSTKGSSSSSTAVTTTTGSTTISSSRLTTFPVTTTTLSDHPKAINTTSVVMFGQVSDAANEIHKIPILELTTVTTTRETRPPLTLDYAGPGAITPNNASSTLTPARVVNHTTTPLQSTVAPSSTEYTENCTETSCTIFAETVQPNTTTDSSVLSNQTATFNQTASLETSLLNSTGNWSTNQSSLETLVTLSPISNHTRVRHHAGQEELVTLTSHLHDSSTTSSLPSFSTTTSSTTTATTLATVPHTLAVNKTLGTVRPEPRRRQPIRRMY